MSTSKHLCELLFTDVSGGNTLTCFVDTWQLPSLHSSVCWCESDGLSPKASMRVVLWSLAQHLSKKTTHTLVEKAEKDEVYSAEYTPEEAISLKTLNILTVSDHGWLYQKVSTAVDHVIHLPRDASSNVALLLSVSPTFSNIKNKTI